MPGGNPEKQLRSDPETVRAHCGEWDIDILSGWEAGLIPRKRVDGRLRDTSPPEHLTGNRFRNWIHGYRKAREYRESVLSRRTVHFVGQTRSGEEVVVVRKGWSVDRGQVITQLYRRGVMGDVWVYYFDGSNLERKIRCGI